MPDRLQQLVITADELDTVVGGFISMWDKTPEGILVHRPQADAWSIKEVLGHLIDSASNNHQRFVRLQIENQLSFPNYGKYNSDWVRIQCYQDTPWQDLLSLWRHINRHLARIMRQVDKTCLDNVWLMDGTTPVSLFDMMTDYLAHLKNHLDQIDDLKASQQIEN